MSIEEILDDMDELLDKAGSVPFANHKAIIDAERLGELINDIRLNLPQEIKHAKMVAFDRDRIIKEAEAKAEQIVRQAEDRAKVMISEEAIVREAKNRAVEAVTKAKAECDQLRAQANSDVLRVRNECDAIKQATDTYIVNRFKDAEAYYATALKDVQERKTKLEKLKKRNSKKAEEPTEQAANPKPAKSENGTKM